MHVLITETLFGDADRLAERLREVGCRVSRCHGAAGICQALAPGGRCPLDGPEPVDLVVDVRTPVGELTAREFGIVCGIRAGVRAAAVSVTGIRPYLPPGLAGRATATTEDDLIRACRDAALARA
jgi:hypothetical protein